MKGEWIQKLLRGDAPGEMPELSSKRGSLYSTVVLEKYIEEEIRHDDYSLSAGTKRSIRTFSSGEQRKALLDHLIANKPDFLVIDNPFDCLDSESVSMLQKRFSELAMNMPVVQIFKRSTDLLPFISHIALIRGEKLEKIYTREAYLKKHLHPESGNLRRSIPGAPMPVPDIPGVLVEMKNVSVSYGERRILREINWKIGKGEFWQLTGPNGSGKTTLLTMIYGDNPKAYGVDLYLFGRKKGTGETVWEIKKKIGYFTPSMTELFQRNNTVGQMVISGLLDTVGLYRKATGLQEEIAEAWLHALDMYAMKDQPFRMISQVHQRMVLIVRAMIKHPPLLILDEPSTGLDDYSASLLTELINTIAAESQTAILYVSHRKEPGLKPERIYRLVPGDGGSVGMME